MKMNRHVCRRIPLCLQNMGFNFRHCKLFHCNGVLFDQNAVTFENILSDENKLRVLKALQKYDLPSLRKVTVSGDHRKAAVLIPLCTVKGEPSILFMVRSNKILCPPRRGEVSILADLVLKWHSLASKKPKKTSYNLMCYGQTVL